ncbi:MAG: class I SAM-dependent methyltransferase [Gammaproteobacteria bacterium]|jgi:O-antigen chain-terminating methyltransferase|nr:class I SAM-dependent methyltransferase [Gammaproteobacteria bacterium]
MNLSLDKATRRPSLVIVREQDAVPHCDNVSAGAAYLVVYRFVETWPNDGFASWVIEESVQTLLVDVTSDCRELSGSFKHQALNRIVAQALIRQQADCLVVEGLWGCTQDLPRVADLLGIPVIAVIGPEQPNRQDGLPTRAERSLVESFRRCSAVLLPEGVSAAREALKDLPGGVVAGYGALPQKLNEIASLAKGARAFSYSIYEFLQRDPALLAAMQAPDVRHFVDCRQILDVACGAGIFLDCLRASNLQAVGVERDPLIAEYARGMGLTVVEQDAIEFLATTQETYDGVYCSHFVEHLPMDVLQDFITALHGVIEVNGILVLSFPDPESIRSQLLGFWRDPEHVRFYHPELITSLAIAAGFEVEWSSYHDQPHAIAPFSIEPEPLPDVADMPLPNIDPEQLSFRDRLLIALGIQPVSRQQLAESALLQWSQEVRRTVRQHQSYLEQLAQRTESLWAVNRTWAWNDNVTLRLRRR